MRHRRKRGARAARFCLMAALPAAAALSVKGAPAIRAAVSAGNVPAGYTESLVSQPHYAKNGEPDIEDILGVPAILSEGYGCFEETPDTSPELTDPLQMVPQNAGAKPYPTEWSAGGQIVRTTYGTYSGETYFDLPGGGQVNNKTTIPNADLMADIGTGPDFTVTDTDEPLVLIYHTHTTESFEPFVRDTYDAEFNYRTTDDTKNVVMVGDAIQAELESRGIGVIHARDIHDYPSYNGSYARSRETIEPILEQYPSIKVVLDIHRDAISGEGVAYQPYIEVGGKEAAQIMIISGCDDGTLGMPDYMKNFHFACALQQKIETDTPGLTRPILFDYRHYNQDLTTGSLLIEVGSHGNTLSQVQYSGQLFGCSLADFLCTMREEK